MVCLIDPAHRQKVQNKQTRKSAQRNPIAVSGRKVLVTGRLLGGTSDAVELACELHRIAALPPSRTHDPLVHLDAPGPHRSCHLGDAHAGQR